MDPVRFFFAKLPRQRRRQLKQSFNRLIWKVAPLVRVHRATVSRRAPVVAISGTAGKTTTTRLCLSVAGRHGASFSGANYRASITRDFFRQTSFRKPYVLELGTSRPGELRLISRDFRPTIAILLAATADSEHMRSFRDRAHVLENEADLLRALPRSGFAILNGDDPEIRALAGETRARPIMVGLGLENDVRATDLCFDWPRGTNFTLHAGGKRYPVRMRLHGRPMLLSALGALAFAWVIGADLRAAIAKVEAMHPTPGRLQPMRLPNGALALRDDYKASVETMYAAIDFLEELPAARRLAVIGGLESPPNPQRQHYKAVGRRLAEVADRVILICTSWKDYRSGLIAAGMPRENIVRVRTTGEATDVLRDWLNPGDLVLVKGRNVQHLTRVILAANGRTVRCIRRECHLAATYCDDCKYLEKGAP